MTGRHRRRATVRSVRWLRVGAATAGLGAAITIGNGIAAAAPSDGPDSSRSGDAETGTHVRPQLHRQSVDRIRPRLSAQLNRLDRVAEKQSAIRARRDAAVAARTEITGIAAAIATPLRQRPPTPTRPDRILADLTARLSAATEALGVNIRRVTLQPAPSAAEAAAATPPLVPEAVTPADAPDLTAREGVSVSRKDDATVKVIDGAFTDKTVTTAADAAALLNSVAPQLGASAGFADSSAITVQHIGGAQGDAAETFYRLHETVNGVPVLGSEVILVTDGNGKVTGLFNNHDSRVDTLNAIPAAKIDDENEAAAVAVAAYLGSAYPGPFRLLAPALIEAGVVQPELVIDARDSASTPQLVWRVVVNPAKLAQQLGSSTPDPGSTYFIDADGADAGTVLARTSNAQPLSTTATDLSGQTRQIDISRVNLLLFNLDYLRDAGRGISTYDTFYLLFGQGPPFTPGIIVFRGLSGWNTSAVSAQANVTQVYDYYSTVLGLTSYDGQGAAVDVSVGYNPHETAADYTDGYDNAFWDATNQQFAFGDQADLESAVDIVGHEFTHAVISYAIADGGSPLDSGESGALNEAYADIMGSLIEGKDRDDPGRWLIGEDSTFDGGAVRNLADPGSIETTYGPYRDNYANRYTGDGDEGGEHVNSTIFSNAAYRMMTDPVNADISDETWARVFYHSMYRLSPGADFSDGRAAVLSTVALPEYGFTDPQKLAVANAFDTVGIA